MKDSTPQNLQQKIFRLFDEKKGNDAELEQLRKKHRQEYLRQKHQEYKAKWHKETLRFTDKEINELTALAQKYGFKRAPFLKACIWGYINDTYIMVDDATIRNLELEINEIQNILNESLRYIHLNATITIDDIEVIKQHVHRLENKVSDALRNPPSLRVWVQNQIKNDENFVEKLQAILTEITNDY